MENLKGGFGGGEPAVLVGEDEGHYVGAAGRRGVSLGCCERGLR